MTRGTTRVSGRKRITEAHDGTLTFESKQVKGTTFLVTLPRRLIDLYLKVTSPQPRVDVVDVLR
ncbi:MAG: hypothetical protein ACXVIE_08775 [Halobacteriota archaeon]